MQWGWFPGILRREEKRLGRGKENAGNEK